MATPPTFVAEYENAPSVVAAGAKTVSVTVAAGDVLVIYGFTESNTYTLATPTGGGLTYTLQQSIVVVDYCTCYVWTAPSAGSQTYTLSITMAGGTGYWGFAALRFSGSDGIGNSAKTNVLSGAPSLALTTGADNSAIVAGSGDWNAVDGASRTWQTINSVTPTSGNGLERTYARDASRATMYGAYWSDAGAAGSKTTGLSAPSGQKYSIIAVEVEGTASTGTNANAESAAGTGAAETPTVTVSPNVEHAAATGAANNPTVTTAVVGTAENAAATGAAQDATTTISPSVEHAAAVGAAETPSVSIAVNAEVASAAATANDATVSTGTFTNATAECATASGAANDPSVSIAPSVENASAVAAAGDPSAGVATGSEAATATATANNPTVTTGSNALAECATAIGAAVDVGSLLILASVEAATALAQALDAVVGGTEDNATSTPLVTARHTSIGGAAARRTSAATVTARRTSGPSTSDG